MADAPDYNDIYESAGRQWGVDPRLLKAVAQKESEEGRNPSSRYPNASGAQGVMQFIPPTAATYNVDVNDPWSSIYAAGHYLRDLLDQNKGDLNLALSHYGNDMDGHKGYAKAVRALYDPMVAAQQNQQAAAQPNAPGDQPPAPNIVDMTKQAGFGNRFGNLGPVQGMIIHHTGGGSDVNSVINTFHQTNFPAQFVIDKNGTIYQTLPDGAQGQQIQTGKGLGTGLSNANTIGVEIIAKDNNDVNPAQIAAGQQLTNFLGNKYNFNPYTQVYGHGEVNPGHKEVDEGQGTTYAQRYAMATPPQPPAPGTVPGPTYPPGQAEYRGGLPPTVAFNSQGVPYNPYAVGANAVPQGVAIPAHPSPGVVVAGIQPDDDFSHLATPAAAAPAPQQGASPTMATKAADDDFSHLITPQQSEAAAPAVADPEIYPTGAGYMPPSVTQGGPAPNWFQRNISNPLAAAWSPVPAAQQPSQNYLLGSPLAQQVVAGPLQGLRNVDQTLTGWAADLNQRYPDSPLARGDRYMGWDPAASYKKYQTEADANQAQYASEMPFQVGRIGGELLGGYALTPGLGPGLRIAGDVVRRVPYVGPILAGAGEGGVAGGVQNALTSPGQNPAEAFKTGAEGGMVVGGALGLGGGAFGPRVTPETAVADRLGIRMTAGQSGNRWAQNVEAGTAPFPGSGAEKAAQGTREDIAGAIGREMGIPQDVTRIDTNTLNDADNRIGNALEDAAGRITVPGTPLISSLAPIERTSLQFGPNTDQAHGFRDVRDQILNSIDANGDIPGDKLKVLIARGGPIDNMIGHQNGQVDLVGQQVRKALLDAAQNGTPQTADALRDLQLARYQYKVMKAVEPAIQKTMGGTDEMSLPALANSINRNFDMSQTGPLANMQDLSRLISGPFRGLPSSTLPPTTRSALQKGFAALTELGGVGALGGAVTGVLPALGFAGVGAGVPALAGRLSRFGPGLGNSLMSAGREALNPLMPRMVGPAMGQNWLANQQPQTP